MIIYPTLYASAFLYVGAQIFFGSDKPKIGTMLFAGNILPSLMTLTYKFGIELLSDLEQQRFTDYQITLLSPRLLLLERIIFTAFFTFVLLVPFFPISKLLFPAYFITDSTSWIALYGMLALSSLFCSAYHLMIGCLMKNSQQTSRFWIRINQPLLFLGGLWAPHSVICQFSPYLGFFCYANPFMYSAEGIRQALFSSTLYFSLKACFLALCAATLLCTTFCFYGFKRKIDHI